MPRVVVTETASADLAELIDVHHLPGDTRTRVKEILRPLERFPEMGSPLGGRWEGARFLLGPWSWMILVYRPMPDRDQVAVTTIQDARRAEAASGSR